MIAIDTQSHFYAGLAICLAVSLFVSPVIGLAVALLAGAIKEGIDALGFGTPDKWDFVATAIGGLVGFALLLIKGA